MPDTADERIKVAVDFLQINQDLLEIKHESKEERVNSPASSSENQQSPLPNPPTRASTEMSDHRASEERSKSKGNKHNLNKNLDCDFSITDLLNLHIYTYLPFILSIPRRFDRQKVDSRLYKIFQRIGLNPSLSYQCLTPKNILSLNSERS